MIAKIKKLAKKIMTWAVKARYAVAKKTAPLWSNRENRLLLILIGAVLVLLVTAVILFFGVDWNRSVGICYRDDTDASNAAFRQVLEQTLAEKGYAVTAVDADNDQARQLEQIRQMAQDQCDAVIVEPVMVSAGQELSQAVAEADIPCVFIGRQPESGTEQIPCVVLDTGYFGALLGQMVAELPDSGDINGDGTVSCLLIYGTEQNTEETAFAGGVTAAFSGSQIQPQIQYSGWGKWTKDGGQQICTESLAAYGKDIEVIFCMNDAMAMGAAEAIADGGRNVGADVYLYSIGGGEQACRMVQSGGLTGTLHADLQQHANAVIQIMLAQIESGQTRAVSRLEYFRVTQENAGQYIAQND